MATLTTDWLQLGQTKVGTDSYGATLYVRIYARYTELDIPNNRSKVQYQARAYFDKSWMIYDRNSRGSVSGTDLSTVSFTRYDNYNSGETTLGTAEGWITHNSDGTKSISASANLVFPNWGWNATASGTATLPTLHTPPTLTIGTPTELNTMAGITTQVVEYLSKKQFPLTFSFNDSATLATPNADAIKIYDSQGNLLTSTLSNITATSAKLNVDLQNQTLAITGTTTNFIIEIKDSLNGVTRVNTANYTVVPYRKPNLVQTSSSVKRNGQTTGKVNLKLAGTFYNGNVGSTANTITLTFKYWRVGTTEPTAASSYYPITFTATSGSNDISISNWTMQKSGAIITDVDKRYAYNFKIKAVDKFNSANPVEILLLCPSGEYLWCEFADRVDFKKITVNNVDPFSIVSNEERIVGTWFGKPLYQKTIQETTSATDTRYDPSRYGISNIKECMFDFTHSYVHYKVGSPAAYKDGMGYIGISNFITTGDYKNFYFDASGRFTFKSGDTDEVKWVVTLLYTKTTD